MFCTNCGYNLKGDEQSCPNCGFSLTTADENSSPKTNQTDLNTNPFSNPFDQQTKQDKEPMKSPFDSMANSANKADTIFNTQVPPVNDRQTPPNFGQQIPQNMNVQTPPNMNAQTPPNMYGMPPNMNQMPPNMYGGGYQQMPPNGSVYMKKKKKSKAPLAILLIIVLVAGSVLGYFAWDKWLRPEDDTSGTKVKKTLSESYTYVLKASNLDIVKEDYNNVSAFTVSTAGKATKVELINKANDEVYEMIDTGDTSLKDDIANDGIFNYALTIDNSKEKEFEFYAKVTTKEKVYETNTITVNVMSKITQEEADGMAAVFSDSNLKSYIDKINQTNDDSEIKSAKKGIVAYFKGLEDDGTIKDLKGGVDEGVVTFKFENGIIGGFVLDITKDAEIFSADYGISDETLGTVKNPALKANDADTGEKLFTVEEGNVVGNNKVLILSSFSSAPSNFTKSYTDLKEKLDSYKDYDFETEIVFDAKLSDYRSKLSGYGQIYINSHGSMYNGEPMICLDEAATSTNYIENSADLKAGRIGAFGTALDYDANYAIFPSFIEYYYMFDELPNSLVYMCICHGFESDGLANAFLNAGAQTITGFTDSVLVSFDKKIIGTYVDELLSGKTTEKAVDETIATNGTNDGDDTPAYFEKKGNPNLVILNMGILNGSFEEKLKYWAYAGDCRIISSLTDLYPTDKSLMSIISTGLGSVTDSASSVSQTFIVPKNATSIKFDYDVVSEEPMEYVDSSFDDVVTIEIIDSSGNVETLVYENINDSSWNEVGDDYFNGGDATTYDTTWQNVSFDISAYRGKCITIKFRTYDVGDSAYDTAGLIDNVRLYVED